MRSFVSSSLVFAIWAILCPGLGIGGETNVSSNLRMHPWGRFQPGAWKLCRTTTENYDEHGRVTSVSSTDTKTTLRSVDSDGVTLLMEAVVEMSGKRLDTSPRTVRQGLHGEMLAEKTVIRSSTPGEVAIERQNYPCNIEVVENSGRNSKTLTTTYYSETTAPYVLKRESVTQALESGEVLSNVSFEVTSLAVPCDVLSQVRRAARVKVVSTHAGGTTTTWAFTSAEIPGGIICHTASELDRNGRLVSRCTLKMLDFGLQPESHGGPFNRVRSRAHRSHRSAM